MKKLEVVGVCLITWGLTLSIYALFIPKLEEVCLKEEQVCEWQEEAGCMTIEDNTVVCPTTLIKLFGDGVFRTIKQKKVCHQVCTQKIMAKVVK